MSQAAISGNLDSPEGGFDALMQAVACKVRHDCSSLDGLSGTSCYLVELLVNVSRI